VPAGVAATVVAFALAAEDVEEHDISLVLAEEERVVLVALWKVVLFHLGVHEAIVLDRV